MAKRIITRIGEVFCVEVDGIKRFFQYISNDSSCLNSSVIRVFKTKYTMDYVPIIENIVSDKVEFYAHTIIRVAIETGICYKVGKSHHGLSSNVKDIIPFISVINKSGYAEQSVVGDYDIRIWCINRPIDTFSTIPKDIKEILEVGDVIPMPWILERLKRGYYIFTALEFLYVIRKPYPNYESYTKKLYDNNIAEYFHFKGETLIERFVVKVSIDIDKEIKDLCHEPNIENISNFGDINWLHRDFITKEEYEGARNRMSMNQPINDSEM